MQGSWVSPSRHDECMDNKIYSESFIEKYLEPSTVLYAFFFTSTKLEYKCILIG